MAKKKTNEYSGFDDLPENTQQAAKQDYIAWENKTNAQRLDSIADYGASIINKIVGISKETGSKAFWQTPANSAELDASIPYNGSTGMPYTNLDNILMRSVMAIEGYQEPIFLTMKQANKMSGVLKKTGEMTRNGKEAYQLGVKVAQLRTHEFVPEFDKNGNKVMTPALDENGKEILTKKGEVAMNVKGEWKELKEPMYESVTLYNIEQFDNLDRSKLKELNLKPLQAKREQIARQAKGEEQFKFKFKSLEGKTGTRTLNNLRDFIKATQTGKDFTPLVVNRDATKEFANTQEKQQGFSR